jgi:hypothetical protein
MKHVIIFFSLIFSFKAISINVTGTITYKMSNGNLAFYDVLLDLPHQGATKVTLKTDNFLWETDDFLTYSKDKQKFFIIRFYPDEDKKKSIILKGTYLNGRNKVLYYGDLIQKKNEVLTYLGAFRFNYAR